MPELPRFLVRIWEALTHPLFTIQETQITLMTGLALVVVIIGSIWLAGLIERTLLKRLFTRFNMEAGLAFTLGRIAQYVVVGLGIFLGLQLVGIELAALAVVFGFLSIGIGFGLQNITSNFVSGLIIMFERPIKPGDRVTVGENVGQVHSIRLRSTTIVTNDNVAVIVPNSQFISQQVVNWSYGDPKLRLHVPVGLAYGTDPEAAKEALLAAARSHPAVMLYPAPDVWLVEFGDNALIFELLVWILNPPESNPVKSALNYAILKECTERRLEIAFPQRDLHLKTAIPVRIEQAE